MRAAASDPADASPSKPSQTRRIWGVKGSGRLRTGTPATGISILAPLLRLAHLDAMPDPAARILDARCARLTRTPGRHAVADVVGLAVDGIPVPIERAAGIACGRFAFDRDAVIE